MIHVTCMKTLHGPEALDELSGVQGTAKNVPADTTKGLEALREVAWSAERLAVIDVGGEPGAPGAVIVYLGAGGPEDGMVRLQLPAALARQLGARLMLASGGGQ